MTRHKLRGLDLIAARIAVDENGCWLWTGRVNAGGYGVCGGMRAHQFTYRKMVGEVPVGFELDHHCRITMCANPFHLEPVTPAENRRRRYDLITHCPRGHEYTPENTRLGPGIERPHRFCRTCQRITDRARAPRRQRALWSAADAAERAS